MATALKKPGLRGSNGADFACETGFEGLEEGIRRDSKAGASTMALVGQALQFAPVRQRKIDAIRWSLLQGRYRLDAKATAQAMLAQGCDLSAGRIPEGASFATLRGRYNGVSQRSIDTRSRAAADQGLSEWVRDLNKQLGVIMAHTELMNLDAQLDSIHRMHLQVIRRQAARLHNLIARRLHRGLTAIADADERMG